MPEIQNVLLNDGSGVSVITAKVLKDQDKKCLGDIILDADILVNHTLGQSRAIIDRAQEEALAAVSDAGRQGYTKGYEEGFQEGVSEETQLALQERQPLVDELSSLCEKFAEYYPKPTDNFENMDKAFELAQKIIAMELYKNDDAFFGLYRKAALHISNVDSAVLKVGPRGLKAAEANRSKFENAIEGLGELKVVLFSDDDGLCQLETSLGNIDTSIGAQLKRAKDIISPQG